MTGLKLRSPDSLPQFSFYGLIEEVICGPPQLKEALSQSLELVEEFEMLEDAKFP